MLYEHRAAPAGVVRAEAIDGAIAHVPRPPHSVKLKGAAKTISLQVRAVHICSSKLAWMWAIFLWPEAGAGFGVSAWVSVRYD